MPKASYRLAAPLLAGGILILLFSGCSVPSKRPPSSPIRVPLIEKAPAGEAWESHLKQSASQPQLRSRAALDEFRLYAAAHNPGLRALYQRWQAQAERAPQVRALPEPRFTYTEYLRSVETRTGPQERSFALNQAFPWFGKLSLRGSIEEKKAAAAWQRFLGAQLALDHQLRATYADYFYLGRSVAVTRENLELLSRLEGVARGKFAAGAENHPDLIRLQVEIGRLEDRLKTLLDMKRPLQAKLNALLSRPAETEIAWPTELSEDEFELDGEQLARLLEEHNPELVALQDEIDSSDLKRDLAAKEYFPDVSLGIQTIATDSAVMPNTRDSGEDPWMVSFSVELPLWFSKYRAGEREAEANSFATRQKRNDATNRLVSEVELALYELRDAKRRAELYADTLTRKAEEALASTEASFQADSSDFLDLIDAERVLLEFQLSRERARADRLRAQAKLDRHLGRYVLQGTQPETRS